MYAVAAALQTPCLQLSELLKQMSDTSIAFSDCLDSDTTTLSVT